MCSEAATAAEQGHDGKSKALVELNEAERPSVVFEALSGWCAGHVRWRDEELRLCVTATVSQLKLSVAQFRV